MKISMVFEREKVICRIISAFLLSTALSLLFGGEGFYELSYAQGNSIFVVFLSAVFCFAFASLLSFYFDKILPIDSWILMLGATMCAVIWILDYPKGENKFLVALSIIVIYSLFTAYFVRKNSELLSSLTTESRVTLIIIALLGIISFSAISTIGILRYLTFSAPNYDFGIFCNMFHHMKESGLPIVSSERDMLLSHFAVHISPIYYLILPFYMIFPSPLTLQIAQAVIVASGIIPVYLLCKHKKFSGGLTLVVALIYAFYPALSSGCFYDIHENCFLAPLLLWMFYFFERQKYLPTYIFVLAVLLVKEDAAIYILIFAIYLLLSKKKYLHGTIIALLSLSYFAFAVFMLEKFGTGAMVNRFDNLIYNTEDGLFGVIKTAILNPGYLLTQIFTDKVGSWNKLVYFLQMLLPLGFIPFCTKKPSRWLLITPMLINLLTMYKYQFDINYQYQFGISAFLIYALIQNLPELHTPTKRTLTSIAATACACLYIVSVAPKISQYESLWQANRDTYIQMEEILDTLPTDASLNVSTGLLPHVADRNEVYEVNYHKDKTDVDYVVLDIRNRDKKLEAHLDAYLNSGYEVFKEYEGLILILKK